MDSTVLKVAMAALLHDIGKFVDRDCMGLGWEDIDESEKQLYLPFSNGRYSHTHALYTALFFRYHRGDLPLELQQDFWGDGDSLVNLAAGHHKPSTPMQWVITVADRVSSGWDRDDYDRYLQAAVPYKDYKRTRMLPLFEQLTLAPENQRREESPGAWRYPLAAVSADSIFPQPADRAVPSDNAAAAAEYRRLAESFAAGLKSLVHRERIDIWYEHCDSLLMLHTTALPSARAGNVVPDVSLYDHSRATAALAAAIYQYHAHNGTLSTEAVADGTDRKLLMVQGSFQGIQNFIFSRGGDSQRHRSKLLRGRSFAVTLMTELAVDMLCRRIGLPPTSVILNAAGRFTLVAPNTDAALESIRTARKTINDWLAAHTFGETRIVLTSCPLSCNDLVSGNFASFYDRLTREAEEEKYAGFDLASYAGAVSGYLDTFHNAPGRPAICPICGKRPALLDAGAYLGEGGAACALCRDHIFLGTGVVKWDRVVISEAGDPQRRREGFLYQPLFGAYQVRFEDGGQPEAGSSTGTLRCWQLRGRGEHSAESPRVTARFINGYVPRYREEDLLSGSIPPGAGGEEPPPGVGDPMTLNHLAACALSFDGDKPLGTEALGVLKADVDFLGALISCGLPERRQTLSRAAALSRQLNWFFAVYLPSKLADSEQYRTTYTVFAGGDDLFLIGPWNRMLALASDLRSDFQRYVCDNEHIHLSAGISLHKPHTPISKLAESSELALEKAKGEEEEGRNRVTVFDETVAWVDYERLVDVRRKMEAWLDGGRMSRVFFYRLNDFISMAARERKIRERREVPIADMACTKWRSLLSYSAERNIGKAFKGDERREIVGEVTAQLAAWMTEHGSSLRIPLWTILYNRR